MGGVLTWNRMNEWRNFQFFLVLSSSCASTPHNIHSFMLSSWSFDCLMKEMKKHRNTKCREKWRIRGAQQQKRENEVESDVKAYVNVHEIKWQCTYGLDVGKWNYSILSFTWKNETFSRTTIIMNVTKCNLVRLMHIFAWGRKWKGWKKVERDLKQLQVNSIFKEF